MQAHHGIMDTPPSLCRHWGVRGLCAASTLRKASQKPLKWNLETEMQEEEASVIKPSCVQHHGASACASGLCGIHGYI